MNDSKSLPKWTIYQVYGLERRFLSPVITVYTIYYMESAYGEEAVWERKQQSMKIDANLFLKTNLIDTD